VSKFSRITTDELLAEIVRRRNARLSRRPIVNCDSCWHFKADDRDGQHDDYNPCMKGHKMSFRMPEMDNGPPEANEDWGFYRNCCADRVAA
jgi:hypothetical protein